jgi:hypothetical protein
MSLILNNTDHWQLSDDGELYSGEPIELHRDEQWIPGRIEYRPRKGYVLILESGEEVPIHPDLEIRAVERRWRT